MFPPTKQPSTKVFTLPQFPQPFDDQTLEMVSTIQQSKKKMLLQLAFRYSVLSSFQVGDAGNKQKIEQFCSTAAFVVVVTMRRTLKKLNPDSSEWLLLFLFFAFVFVRGGVGYR